MSTVVPPQQVEAARPPQLRPEVSIKVYSHSPIVYWWPVWAVGYLLALLTYFQGVVTTFGEVEVLIHPSPSLGVLFTATFLLVLIIMHGTVRGPASLTVIFSLLALAFFFAYMGWWDPVLRLMGRLALYMNLGFYIFFSTAVFMVWAARVFFIDRLDYWEFRPGQAIHHTILGGGAEAYDARGMVVDKLRNDLFRHWILGLGSGDMHVSVTGAKKAEFVIRNVLFIGSKLTTVQRLAAMQPDDDPAITQAPLPPA